MVLMSAGPLAWQVGKWVLIAVALAAFGLTVFVAFARRDHKVALIVTYPKSPPNAVWRLLTDHASEPKWLPAFGTVVRQPDIAGREVWTHTSPDGSFSATAMTLSAITEQRYERLLLRDGQPRGQSWDGRWIYELQPSGNGTRLTITEYGWSDGFLFFIQQRVLTNPDAFLQYYARMLGRELKDEPRIQVVRSH
jgi:uncharacterized protein YndB with AHSA1/START domain